MAEALIPIVDFGAFPHGAEDEKRRTARAIDEAFQRMGFVYLVNHGVSEEEVEGCFAWSKSFFALPPPTKLLAPHPPGSAHHRGYSRPGLEKVTQHTYTRTELATARSTPDYKESFESGNPTDPTQPNIWPPDTALPGFRPALESAFETYSKLVHMLLDALSLALALPSSLRGTHAASRFQLRLLHYPRVPASALARGDVARIGAHSDFGTLTLLFQDGVGGLQVEVPGSEGKFVHVGPVPGGVLVNVGDLLARWSNGRWRSTVHRVGLPVGVEGEGEGEGEGVVVPDRYSIPFFATADPETVVEALPGCWGEGRPKLFEPVTAEGYVQMRMKALYE